MIELRYKCRCMDAEASIQVPERQEAEDIIQWMNLVVQAAIYLDHRRRSPSCKTTEMEYAKLPMPENAPFIGGKPSVQ